MRTTLYALLVAVLMLVAGPVPSSAQEPPSGAAKTAAVINLNTATADQLSTLPGIGERTAQRILEYRQKNGPFKKPEDLMNVKGIGEKSFLKLKPSITVAPPKSERPAGQAL
jgi:competence protein ComEA